MTPADRSSSSIKDCSRLCYSCHSIPQTRLKTIILLLDNFQLSAGINLCR